MIGRALLLWGGTAGVLALAGAILLSNSANAEGYFPAGVACLAAAVGAAALVLKHIPGTVFDTGAATLEFPGRLGRARVLLAEIRDANFDTGKVEGAVSGKKYREFRVNLSGDFGSQQLRFATKARRDQFASILRRVAPHVRISRWY